MLAALIASSRRVWVEDMVGMLAKIGLTFFVRTILDEKMRMSLVRPLKCVWRFVPIPLYIVQKVKIGAV